MKKLTKKSNNNTLFGRLKKYLTTKSLKSADLILTGVVVLLIFFCWMFSMPFSEVFETKLDILYGYNAKENEKNLYYVVDDGHKRLICFDKNSNIQYTLESPANNESGGGLYIDDFAVDQDGLVYLAASEWNGMLLDREVIAIFKGTKCIRTIMEQDYSDMNVNKHRFYGIRVQDGVLSYAECDADTVILHRVSLSDYTDTTSELAVKNAFNAVSDCAFYQDTVYIMTKNGIITSYNKSMQTDVYSTRWEGEEDRIPYRMSVSTDGAVFFTDIRNSQAVKVDTEKKTTEVVLENIISQTVNFTADGKGLLYLEDDGLMISEDSKVSSYLSLSKTTGTIILQIIWFIAMIVLCIVGMIFLLRIILSSIGRQYTVAQMVSCWVIGAVVLVSGVLCAMLINNFSATYRQQLMDQIENSALVLANQIPEGTISELNRAEDFDSDAYQQLSDVMERVFPSDLEFNQQLYCNILRLSDDGEDAYAVAYLDQSIGVYFPLDEVDIKGVKKAYKSKGNAVAIWDDNVADVSGTYLSVKVPVYENGVVKGVVMVGSETYIIQDMITRLRTQIILSIVVIIMLIWLIGSEVMAWFSNKEKYTDKIHSGQKNALPGHFIRILVFSVFACFNMTATFLPVWILRNSDLFSESSRDFMASLPITVNIFIIGVMSLFTASAVRRLGIGRILTISTLCSLCGNLMMFIAPSYVSVFAGMAIDGVGVGLITNATYILLTYIQDEEDKQWGFTIYNTGYLAGMNFGMLLGSLLAVVLGQRSVFVIVAAIWLVLMLIGNVLVRALQGLLSTQADENTGGEKQVSVGHLLGNRPVMSFILLVQNPYIIFNSFVFYYVPLFCGNMGYDETIVSILIMVYSEIAVLTGELLIQIVSKRFGNRGMYLAYGTNILAVLVFALTQNMSGIILALLMMGTAAAYGKPMQQTWFLKQKQAQDYGEDRAMGVYNFSENIGESIGPIVFARLMSQTPLFGAISGFCGAIFALGSGHFFLNRKGLKELK